MPSKHSNVVRAASILIVVSAVLMLVQAVYTLQNVGSTGTVDGLNKALNMSWAKSSHLTVPAMQGMLRVGANVAAVLAAAVAVLAVFAGRGSGQARVGLGVLAVPTFVAGLMSGAYAVLPLVVGIGMLWSRNARAWFRGEEPESAADRPVPPSREARPLPDGVPAPPPPFSTAPPKGRPQRVTSAAAVAIVLSAVAAAGGLLSGVGFVLLRSQPDLRQTTLDRLRDQNVALSPGDLDRYLPTATILAAVLVLLALAGILAAVQVLRGSAVARIVLIVLSAVSGLISLVMISSIVSVIWLVGSISVIVGLAAADSVAWFRRG